MIDMNGGLFTSLSGEWETPKELFKQLDKEFGFSLDVCATKENTKCDRYFTKEDNALELNWGTNTCWMNPPYGREIGKWIKKAYESSLHNSLVVCLVPSRTDTRWWHDYCMKGKIRFIKGRLKFGGSKNSAPFPSAIIVFG